MVKIKIVGVGNGGGRSLNQMIEQEIQGVEFIAVNTDVQALMHSNAPTLVHIGEKLTYGLGTGGRPQIGVQAAQESADVLHEMLEGSDLVFIAAGMGGGTGSGAAPVIAEIAQRIGALTVGVVTRPFTFEGSRRALVAEEGIKKLREHVDALFVVPNDHILETCPPGFALRDLLSMSDDLLYEFVRSLCEVVAAPGLVGLDFQDVRADLSESGLALAMVGTAKGEDRAVEASQAATSHGRLAKTINSAKSLIIRVSGGSSLTLSEANLAVETVRAKAHPTANIIHNVVIDDSLEDKVRVTVIAAGLATATEPREDGTLPWKDIELVLDDEGLDIPAFLRRRTGSTGWRTGSARSVRPILILEDELTTEGVEQNEFYAVARIRGCPEDQPMVLNRQYVLEAGVMAQIASDFKGSPISVPAQQGPVEFDIVVYAENMDVEPTWVRPFVYRRNKPSARRSIFRFRRDRPSRRIDFRLTPRKTGDAEIRVEFYHQLHWLTQIQFSVKVVEEASLVPA